MSGRAQILRGPWRTAPAQAPESSEPGCVQLGAADLPREGVGPGRMHLGFVVRECAVALGHAPTPDELARWANHQSDERGEFCLFGRPISVAQARLILSHPGRPVSVRPERARSRGAGEPADS